MASSSSVIGATFFDAARSGDLRLVKELASKLDDGGEGTFDKIRDIEGLTALHYAAAAGNTHICKYLIKQLKLDVNAQDVEGETPLLYATLAGHLLTALYLLDNVADIVKTNKRGATPLHYAALNGRKDFLELFIFRGAEIEANSDLGTPLVYAVQRGHREAVKFLLQNNANPNVVIHNVSTPLLLSSISSLKITDLLVKAGADPNINAGGITPLHNAIAGDNVGIIKCLLKAGANPNFLDSIGLIPLEKATIIGNVQAMSTLFPVTSPIPSIPEWSINGLMKYAKSEDGQEKIVRLTRVQYHMAKSKGEDSFKRKDYFEAIHWYGGAIEADPSDAIVLSNRSLCYARMNLGSAALSDAKACVSLRPDWPKAHYREGAAWKLLKNYHEATKSFSCALKLDPDNQEVQKAFREALEAEIDARLLNQKMVAMRI